MGIKRRHKAGQIRDLQFTAMDENFFTRYQLAIAQLDAEARNCQIASDSAHRKSA